MSKDVNTKTVVTNAINSFGVKGLSMFIALFTLPAYMKYFNDQEVLGIWFTILSVLGWILSCDMGIGNGLRNKLVEVFIEKNNDRAKGYISSSYLFLTLVSGAIVCLLMMVSQFISWNKVFNISIEILSTEVLNKSIFILLLSIFLQFMLQLITSILYALQKSFIPGFLNLTTNVLMLTFVLVSNATGNNNDIIQLAIAYLFAVNIPLLVTSIIVFSTNLKDVAPSYKYCKKSYAISVLKIGGVFLWLQFMAMLLNSTGSYLIAILIGNAAVIEYQVYYKIFTLIGTIITLMTTPIWSAVTKAQSEKNYIWVNALYKKVRAIGCLAVIAEFALIVPLQVIFDIWLQEKAISVNYTYAMIFAIFGSIWIWSSIITCFANGLSEFKFQTVFLTGGAILNIPLAYLFAQLTNSFIAIVIANIISLLPYCIAQTIWFNAYIKKKVTLKQQ